MFASLNLGIGLIIAGLVFVILVWGVLSLIPRVQATPQAKSATVPAAQSDEAEAVVVIQPGGRVDYVNARARDWFGLRESDPTDLERLLRRVRPADDFLDVCAEPGSKRLSVNGKPVEATSYSVPGAYPQMLISLRGMEAIPALARGSRDLASSLLRTVTNYSEAIGSSLDFEAVVRSILENAGRLVPADLLELKAWDEEARAFVTYRFEESNGSGRKLVRAAQSQFGELSKPLIEGQRSLLLNDVHYGGNGHAASPALASYLGIRLMASGEMVGLLEAGQTTGALFSQQDIDLMELVAGQTGAVLRNAMLYEQERRRTVELSGLANLAHAVTAIREPQGLFTRLVESIAPLFDVNILGFLLYDETRGTIEGQVPFRGLPDHIAQIYRAPILHDGPAERFLRDHPRILTQNAAEDPFWNILGLKDVAVAASLRDSALTPLVSGSKMLGYLQLSHHRTGTREFSETELRLMRIVGDQAAAIIENAVLVRQSRERADRSEALQRLSGVSASSTNLDEVLGYALKELRTLFQADAAGAFLLDDAQGELALHRASMVSNEPDAAAHFLALAVDDPDYQRTVTSSQRPMLNGHLSVEHGLPPFYGPLVSTLQLESVMIVPIAARGKPMGELVLGSHTAEYFNDYDAQITGTAAAQLGAAIEGLRLASETDVSLRRRVEQLASVARVSRELAASLSIEHLLNVI
ncbi:MAG TPA: GAF domain-containing protein, partial [Ramlibacter sp.]|nr:GAF domain-containing protein [Ramlibacter sp.]